MKEPIRMRETHELPSALRDAFATLGQAAPSAETTLRVQQALQALPAAAGGAAAVGTLSVSKLLVVATLIAGAATSVVMLKSRLELQRATDRMSGAVDASASQRPSSPRSTQPTQVDPALAASGEVHEPASAGQPGMPLDQGRDQEEELSLQPRATPQPAAAMGRARAKLTAQRLPAPSHQSSPPQRSVLDDPRTPSTQAAPSPEQALAHEQPSAAAQDAHANEAQLPPPPSVAGAQANEAQRLAQCKRLAAHDPAEALRQVEALTREMPSGVFSQERELLAIRLHRRLGHAATAAQLTQRFLERYPNSVYRRALSP